MKNASSDPGTVASYILRSLFFKRTQRRANRLLRNTSGLWDLLKNVSAKTSNLQDLNFITNLKTLSRLLRAYAKGEYKTIPWTTLGKIIAVLIYFVSPLDFIPDLLPIVGFTDDIALVLWVLSSCSEDIKRFEEWEAAQALPVTGD